MTVRDQFDVAVVGAGLAGSAAAILLAGRGWRVALLERRRYPHDKLCGEFLSPETEPVFRRLGVWERVVACRPPALTETLITAPGGASFRARLPGRAHGLSRLRLDPLLVERAMQAGATFHEGAPVTGIAGTLADGFTLTIGASDREQQSVAARVVLGAWGKRATPDRALGRAFFQRKQPFLALKAHYHGPDTGAAVELHAFAGGYLGLSAIEGGRTNLCLLATEIAFRAAGRSADRLLEHIGRQNPVVAARLHGSERAGDLIAVSQIAFGLKAPVERDVLMLGDAAQLIPPLAGDGMAMALQSAELAAPLVDDFLHGGAPLTLTRAYTTAWHQEFQRRLRFARLVQPLFLRPRLLSLGLHLLRATPRLADYLIRATRGPTDLPVNSPSQT